MSPLNLCTLVLAVMLMLMPAEAAARGDLKDIIVQAKIPKGATSWDSGSALCG